MKISVIVATKNRFYKIYASLTSLLSNSFKDFEIIVVDQSSDRKTRDVVENLNSQRIIYYKITTKGVGVARNFGVRKAQGDILVFTDDDCIVDKYFLINIRDFFVKHKEVYGVFGQVLPYESHKHKGKICSVVFTSDQDVIIKDPYIIHYKFLGIGNNMSFRKSIFSSVGMFRNWLGAGSISLAGAHEGEFIYRVLKSGFPLAFSPNIIVYHNRWNTVRQEEVLQSKYTCGNLTFYFYYLLRGDYRMVMYIFDRINNYVIHKSILYVKRFFSFDTTLMSANKYELSYIFFHLKSLVKAIGLSLVIPFIDKNT